MKRLRPIAVAAFAILAIALALPLRAQTPKDMSGVRTIGDVIAEAGTGPVRIIFVHGMRAEGAGASEVLRGNLCAHVPGGCTPIAGGRKRILIPLGTTPPSTRLEGRPVWRDLPAWEASQPFVDRYAFTRANGGELIVDEVNWWPLLFPLKCRALVLKEAELSGPDKAHLRLCGRTDPENRYYPWLGPDDGLEVALARPSKGALLNRLGKREIMNWGLADAVIAVGPMRVWLDKAMNGAFGVSAADLRAGERLVVISESLGSFVILDAMSQAAATGDSRVKDVVDRTADLYFFANQFRLLELARLEGVSPAAADRAPLAAAPSPAASPSVLDALGAWAAPKGGADVRPRQIVAFNDPSDILTFEVPAIRGAKVVNIDDRNGFRLLGLVADPVAAHTGHAENKKVLKLIFSPSPKPAR